MKYKTFRALMITGAGVLAIGAVAGTYAACSGKSDSTASATKTSAPPAHAPAPSTRATVPPRAASTESAPPATSAASSDASALRPMDQKILEKLRAGFSGDKVKDVFKSEPFKVNLYKEEGKVRAKVDLDRDEKFDEKWDFDTEGGKEKVKRRVSTQDDESYDREYRLEEGRWVEKKS